MLSDSSLNSPDDGEFDSLLPAPKPEQAAEWIALGTLGYTANGGVFESPQGYWGLVVTGVSATHSTTKLAPTPPLLSSCSTTKSVEASGPTSSGCST